MNTIIPDMISVVIPVYNAEKYIEQCILSVLNQKGASFELVIVNDGSDDASIDIIRKYQNRDDNSRPCVTIVDVDNGGQAYARNIGVKHSHGDRIMFLDADDVLFDDALSFMSGIMDCNNSEIVVAALERGGCPDDGLKIDDKKAKVFVVDGIEATALLLYQKGIEASPCAKLFKRNLFEEDGFVEGLYYEDLELCSRFLMKCKRVSVTNQKVYFYRQHEDSFMHIWDKKRLDVLKVVDGIERRMAVDSPSLLPAASDRKFSAYFNIYIEAVRNKDIELAANCWHVIKSYRKGELRDCKVRIKNKLGAALSYLGRDTINFISRFI